jgi:peptide deformylase
MAILEIFKYPSPILRKKAETVNKFDEELRQMVMSMADTMYNAPGVGLAAPQIGVSRRIVVIDITDKDEDNQLIVLINPEIIKAEGSQVDEEGCLSVIDLTAKVKRFAQISVRAHDIKGKLHEFEAEEWFARVIQHEVDHLNGILFIDHLSTLKRALYKKKRKKQLKLEKEEAEQND